jgi:hypothetical protein
MVLRGVTGIALVFNFIYILLTTPFHYHRMEIRSWVDRTPNLGYPGLKPSETDYPAPFTGILQFL